ncbi:RHS repeat-associated core domain-containing protein [Fulvivirgaceae bacterium BMA10]|uniref:RHS repeat-associated core domain-containing protein n=1 Tax=Splendidivirga corallicola TaxID=3051826 RepID=A0ABT8KQT1_9BACT|nr:RHS repeat-associated core domain-containing protein [Fulvivirgaceae bacterium BMA10]
MAFNPIQIEKDGYIYVYLNNSSDSDNPVDFDDLTITHTQSPVVSSDDYYPFGLTFNSTQKIGGVDQRYKFNEGTEFNLDLGVNLYETTFRGYDPALGRFNQPDPLADLFPDWNPYQFAYNDPIFWNDPMGLMNTDSTANPTPEPDPPSTQELVDYLWSITQNGTTTTYTFDFNPYGGSEVYREETENGVTIYYSGEYTVSQTRSRYVDNSGSRSASFTRSQLALGTGAILYGVGESLIYNDHYWLDSRGNFRSTQLLQRQANGKFVRGVQGYRYGYASAQQASKIWKVAGRGTFFVGAGIGLYQGILAYRAGDKAGAFKAGVDITFGAIGTFGGPIGLGISTVYFVVDTTIGWENAFRAGGNLIQRNQAIQGPGWNAFRTEGGK